MADVNRGNRPLSPHITVWRWQVNSITSILVRITGNAMFISAILIVWWLTAAATSESYFAFADGIITSFIGDVVMTLSLLGLWFHTLGGLRHLIWDTGRALDMETSDLMGWGMLFGSVVLTALTVIII
ncbi:succinate dehydrogenase, cytochrome b556 subunit [Rhodobacterales bacterium HKCCE3408]|nr:succinate dehydrogenase, cytochrome b556 subunit [Rhodobacterales bacterium HKCCE3408]